jgi:hypothetical protein
MMKRLLLLLVVSLFFIGIKAQEARFGLSAGMNISSPSDLNSKTGFHAGVKGEYSFSDNLYVGSGLMLTSKGWKSDTYYDASTKQSTTWKATPYYIEMPIHLGYKTAVGENIKLFGEAGPYFDLGVFGKSSYTVEKDNKMTTSKTNNLFKDNQQERFDCGLGASIGVEFYQHYQLSLGYDWGLKKIYKKNASNLDSKNRVFEVSLAYMF